MDRKKSDRIVQNFSKKEPKYKRVVRSFSGIVDSSPEKVFPLLCPTREADWIPGWDAELIYTESGYAEDKCVFRTNHSNSMGGVLWTFTGYQPNEFVEFVRFEPNILTHVRIEVVPNKNETTTVIWYTVSTAITENGNSLIESVNGYHKSNPALKMMEHYLKTGKSISKHRF